MKRGNRGGNRGRYGNPWRDAPRERCTMAGCERVAMPYGFPLHDEQLCRLHLLERLRQQDSERTPGWGIRPDKQP